MLIPTKNKSKTYKNKLKKLLKTNKYINILLVRSMCRYNMPIYTNMEFIIISMCNRLFTNKTWFIYRYR